MQPQNLLQLLKDRIDLNAAINEDETTMAIQCDGDQCRATIAVPCEGKIRLFEVTSRELGVLAD